MRTSLALIAILSAPALFTVTACQAQATPSKPVRGEVVSKEYEPAKTKRVAIKTERCTTVRGKRTCRKVTTGYKTVTTKKECYELDIKSFYSGEEFEVCDKDAYRVLRVGDTYNSSINYGMETYQ